jgi:hypothetical protein
VDVKAATEAATGDARARDASPDNSDETTTNPPNGAGKNASQKTDNLPKTPTRKVKKKNKLSESKAVESEEEADTYEKFELRSVTLHQVAFDEAFRKAEREHEENKLASMTDQATAGPAYPHFKIGGAQLVISYLPDSSSEEHHKRLLERETYLVADGEGTILHVSPLVWCSR